MVKPTTPIKRISETESAPAITSLVGRCFHVFGADRAIERQGVVLAPVGDKHFLVQYFE
jgi:hypothetical protein